MKNLTKQQAIAIREINSEPTIKSSLRIANKADISVAELSDTYKKETKK